MPPQQPTLVLLPGLDGTGKLFSAFIQALGPGVDTIVVAYPAQQPLGYEELEAMVAAALPTDRPFVLLGESFSGPIAIRIAARAPAGLVGLILSVTFAKNPFPWLRWAQPLAAHLPLKSLPRWVRAPLMWGSASPQRATPRAQRAMTGVSAEVVKRRIAALLAVDATDVLRNIRIPTLVLRAGRDRVISKAATLLIVDHLPHAQLLEIDGPHLLLQTRAAQCAAAVIEFLRGLHAESAAE
jgi:pimeloyl-ACP methyl ester carboxylesterase